MREKIARHEKDVPISMPEMNINVACKFTCAQQLAWMLRPEKAPGLGLGRFYLFRRAANCQRLKPTRHVGQVMSLRSVLASVARLSLATSPCTERCCQFGTRIEN